MFDEPSEAKLVRNKTKSKKNLSLWQEPYTNFQMNMKNNTKDNSRDKQMSRHNSAKGFQKYEA